MAPSKEMKMYKIMLKVKVKLINKFNENQFIPYGSQNGLYICDR